MESKLNPAKTKLKSGKVLLMIFLSVYDPVVAELIARSGIDLIVIDSEHNAFSDSEIANIARVVELNGGTCLLRTARKDLELLSHYMDLGIHGICATECNSLANAKLIIDAVKYPPVGKRGIGQNSRSWNLGFLDGLSMEEYMNKLNDNTFIITTLETPEGIAAAEEIAKLNQIDSVHIGPLDLSASMGLGGNSRHPKVQEIIRQTNQKIVAAGNTIGDFVPAPEKIRDMAAAGYRILLLGSDIDILRRNLQAFSKESQNI